MADEAAIAAFRHTANLRTITRNDPSVTDILETSVYSTIYHYEESGWEKQKMEGPTFIVKRDKSPEYAIYMLNRQTVKNVLIPLVKGEMKATIVSPAMLQVARRGEKIKRGIWFSEEESVPKFKEAILRICGEPSQRPESTAQRGDPAASAQPSPAIASSSQSAGISEDGLSKLFAGLISSPSTKAAIPQTATTTTSTTIAIQQTTYPNQPVPLLSQQYLPVQPDYLPVSPSPVSPTPNENSQPGSASVNDDYVHPPGQTVDDLLMSILGATPFPPIPSQSSHQPLSLPSQPGPSISQQAASLSPLPPLYNQDHLRDLPSSTPPPIPENTKPSLNPVFLDDRKPTPNGGRVGNAAFAQAATSPLPQHPSSSSSNHNAFPPNGVSPLPHQHQFQSRPQDPVISSIVDGVNHRIPQTANQGKIDFINNILRLIHTDPSFADELWAEHQRRTGGAGG